jgi:ribosomal protein L37AE/L43A
LKIFGIELFGKKVVKDEVPEIKATIPNSKRPSLMKPVRDPSFFYRSSRFIGRGAFNPSEYDLAEVGRVEDTDSFVRQAMDKKSALMFKEGWDITGPNPKTIKYVKTRFAQIEQATGVPTRSLLRDIGSSLIRKSNAFVIKVRKPEASGGRIRNVPGKTVAIKPVAGYFVAAAETMEYQLNGNKIVKWRHRMPNGDYKDFNPRDIIHIYHDRKDGFIFGTPITVPVMDDIRALRKIEENIELLVYQHLFPLFQYKVGTTELPAGFTETGQKEIDVVKQEIQFMPTEGGIVTPERHEITAIGAEGRAIRAEGYLEHFKKRVFAGLGISAVDMGEGETANRATADNMSRNLIDSVKDYQQVMEAFVNHFVLNELLLESTFGDSVLDEENRCWLKFKEIDVEAQIKREAHFADQFAKNVINLDEARKGMGREPIPIPSRKDMDAGLDTAETYPEWHRMAWKLFEEPKLLIQALDEPWSPLAKAVARTSTLETSQEDIDEAGEQQKEKDLEIEQEKGKTAVAVAKAKGQSQPPRTTTRPSKPKRKDGYLAATFTQISRDTVARTAQMQKLDTDWAGQLVRAQMETTIQQLISAQMLAFREGYVGVAFPGDTAFIDKAKAARARFSSRANRYVSKLTNDVVKMLKRRVNNTDTPDEIVQQTRAVFEALEYRTKFIEDVEIRKARNYGNLVGLRDNGVKAVAIQVINNTACATCQSHSQSLLHTSLADLESVPPFHAACHCIMVNPEATTGQQDGVAPGSSRGKIDEPLPETKGIANCPKCGKTAVRKLDTPDVFKCRNCRHSFRALVDKKAPKGSKQSQFAKCVVKAKARLRTQHPTWDEGRIEMMAEVACDHILQDKQITDGEKMDRCVARVKTQLRKENPKWSDDRVESSAFAICNSSLKGK